MEKKWKSLEKKGGAWKERGTLVIKRPHTEVPQWMPRSQAVNSIATDHKGTTESKQSATHQLAWKKQPVQSGWTKNKNIQTESLSSQRCAVFSAKTDVVTNVGTTSPGQRRIPTTRWLLSLRNSLALAFVVVTFSTLAFSFLISSFWYFCLVWLFIVR